MVNLDWIKRGLSTWPRRMALAAAGLTILSIVGYSLPNKEECPPQETPVCAAHYVPGQDVCNPAGAYLNPTPSLLELLQEEELRIIQQGEFFQLDKRDVKAVATENGVSPKTVAIYNATHDIRDLLYYRLKLINPPERLEGVIFSESSGNVNVGCNDMEACGPGQLKKSGFNGVLDLLYSNNKKAERFRAAHPQEVQTLRGLVDQMSQNYFSTMNQVSKTLKAHRAEVNKRWEELRVKKNPSSEEIAEYKALRTRKNQLYHAQRMIDEGLLLTNEKSQQSSARHYEALKGYGSVNDFFTSEMGMNIQLRSGVTWEDYVRSQGNVVEQAWQRISTQAGAGELEVRANILFADVSLAGQIDTCNGNVPCGMRRYQGITSKAGARHDYSAKVERVSRDNVQINQGLYGDPRLKCNVVGTDQRCEDPSYLKKE